MSRTVSLNDLTWSSSRLSLIDPTWRPKAFARERYGKFIVIYISISISVSSLKKCICLLLADRIPSFWMHHRFAKLLARDLTVAVLVEHCKCSSDLLLHTCTLRVPVQADLFHVVNHTIGVRSLCLPFAKIHVLQPVLDLEILHQIIIVLGDQICKSPSCSNCSMTLVHLRTHFALYVTRRLKILRPLEKRSTLWPSLLFSGWLGAGLVENLTNGIFSCRVVELPLLLLQSGDSLRLRIFVLHFVLLRVHHWFSQGSIQPPLLLHGS
mmetsp:Transcript_12104/g.18217  ORF Transcript_12104/g.18217 Transcript_12104/m.18217 type:complete len:267 (-) Transcript_12104:123-923(-)